MKVILTKDVQGSGKAGALVEVSDGYAKNFLLKKGLAVVADAAAINAKKIKDSAAAHHAQVALDGAKATAARLEGKSVTLHAKAGAGGKLFGSVTAKEIAEALTASCGVEVTKKQLVLDGDIKSFGTYQATVKLHPGVSATVKVVVQEEA